MSVSYASSRNTASKALSTYAVPFQPQKDYVPVTIPTYTRPSDWITVPTPVSGNKVIYLLCAVWNDTSNFIAFTASGAYTVDWGDGSAPVNFTTGAQAEYNYNYSTVSSSVTTRGYKTVLITITPQGAGNLTALDLNKRNSTNTNTGTGSSAAASPILEITICSSALTSLTMGAGTPNVKHSYCEKVTIIENGTISSMASLFNNFQSLQSITLPAAFGTSTTDMSSMFGNCYALTAAPSLVTSSCTTMNNMFQGCNNLLYVPDYNTSNVTAMGSMFDQCRSLVNAPAFDYSKVTNTGTMFQNCAALVNVPFVNATATGLTNIASMFVSCPSLVTVNMALSPSLAAGAVSANNMFQNCFSLANIPTFDYSKFNNVNNMFSTCASLVRFPNAVIDLSNVTNTSNGSNMFFNCYSLESINTIIASTTANIPGNGMFQNCYSLKSISTMTGRFALANMFNGCQSLRSLPTIVSGNAALNAAFQTCLSLESVTIDFAVAPTNFQSTFSGCIKMTALTFLNLTGYTGTPTFQQTFQDCRALVNVPSFPATTAAQTWTSMFNGCFNLRVAPSFDMSGGVTMTSMYNNCYNLQTVPAYTFSNSGNNITSMFQGCYALENIGTQTYGSGTLTTGGLSFIGCYNLSSLRSSNLKVSFSIASAKFSGTQLDQVYTDLPTVTAQTITVTNNWGTATDTPSIATAKGWTVTGS